MPVAAHLLLMRGDEVLLLLRKNTGYEDGKYSVVAGHLDGAESATAAMLREAREEAGIDIQESALSLGCVMHRIYTDREGIDFFFVCTAWKGKIQNMEPHKCGGLLFFKVSSLPENIIPYVRAGIEASQNGIRYVEFGWKV
jgi:8-oxo-dGTP pyrophosphatase MutT (NUDIX family)